MIFRGLRRFWKSIFILNAFGGGIFLYGQDAACERGIVPVDSFSWVAPWVAYGERLKGWGQALLQGKGPAFRPPSLRQMGISLGLLLLIGGLGIWANRRHKEKEYLWLARGLLRLAIVAGGIMALLLPASYFDQGESICYWRQTWGVCCPGCGTTRAVQHLIHGDWKTAYYYHPLVFVTAIALGWVWVQETLALIKHLRQHGLQETIATLKSFLGLNSDGSCPSSS